MPVVVPAPLPNASQTVRGVVDPGTQSFTGPWSLYGNFTALDDGFGTGYVTAIRLIAPLVGPLQGAPGSMISGASLGLSSAAGSNGDDFVGPASGGDCVLRAGNAGTPGTFGGNAEGGRLTLYSGNAAGAGNAGEIDVRLGNSGTGAGYSGSFVVYGGNSQGTGGYFTVYMGSSV